MEIFCECEWDQALQSATPPEKRRGKNGEKRRRASTPPARSCLAVGGGSLSPVRHRLRLRRMPGGLRRGGRHVVLWAYPPGADKREKIPHPEGNMGMLTVNGYGLYKRVWVMPAFEDEDCGAFKVTGDYPDLIFMQEGHKTSVSHLMTLREHIFVIVPRIVEDELDWRLPVFECGGHLIAFDGAALLLNEIYGHALRSRNGGFPHARKL